MKALLARGPGDFLLADRADPAEEPGSPRDGAVVTVEAGGVCAADRMLWRGDGPWELRWPMVPGHEILGRIREITPAAATRWGATVGDRVTAEVKVPCGDCRWCADGREQLCPHGAHLGSSLAGGFAESVALPLAARVHRVPAELATEAAVLAEPTACAVHALRRAELAAGEPVTIIGLGSVGSLAVQVARQGGHEVTVVLRTDNPLRRAAAERLGATRVVSVTSWSALPAPPDAVVECSGDATAVAAALAALAPGGRLVLYGVYRRALPVDWNVVAEFKELTVRGAHLAPGAFPDAVALLAAGSVRPDAVVAPARPLAEFRAALERSPGTTRAPKEVLLP